MGTSAKRNRGGTKTGAGAGTGAGSGKINSVADATNLQELADFMNDKHNVKLDIGSLSNIPLENVKMAAEAIVQLRDEFPGAADYFHELIGDDSSANAFAYAKYNGTIAINPKKYVTVQEINSRYDANVGSGFHPAGTKAFHIVTHEGGHIMERALIDKFINEPGILGAFAKAEAWNRHSVASKVISEAARGAKKLPGGKGKKNAQLISEVSGYANKNRSETLAECVADYVANGKNAKPLSIATWSILKRELG